ncbi:MAG: hypothetical protein ACRER1_08180 [Gammaproteobacteria bacterium]
MIALAKTCKNDRPISDLETLTHAYARYSRSAGGLGSVLGGTLCLASYFCGALLPLTPAVRAALIAMPLVWLGAKLWLTRNYYQRFGHVEEQEKPSERRMYRFCVVVSLLVALAITVVDLIGMFRHPDRVSAGLIGYLVLVWLLPLAAWRWMRSALDFIVGVFLICQAALACVGATYPMIGFTYGAEAAKMSLIAVIFPLVAVIMIAVGVAEHRRFHAIRNRLETLQSRQVGNT